MLFLFNIPKALFRRVVDSDQNLIAQALTDKVSGCVREREADETRQFKSKRKKGKKIILKKWFPHSHSFCRGRYNWV